MQDLSASPDPEETAEKLDAVNQLAADNDKNPKKIVKSGVLHQYVEHLQPNCSFNHQTIAARGCWLLAFTCRKDIRKERGCIEGTWKNE